MPVWTGEHDGRGVRTGDHRHFPGVAPGRGGRAGPRGRGWKGVSTPRDAQSSGRTASRHGSPGAPQNDTTHDGRS